MKNKHQETGRARPSVFVYPGKIVIRIFSRQAILLTCTLILILSSLVVTHDQNKALAANPGSGNGCSWYTVRWGDTLSNIAGRYHTTYPTLARVNNIRNVNLIFVNQQLCIPVRQSSSARGGVDSERDSGQRLRELVRLQRVRLVDARPGPILAAPRRRGLRAARQPATRHRLAGERLVPARHRLGRRHRRNADYALHCRIHQHRHGHQARPLSPLG